MGRLRNALAAPERRMLSEREAAAYCGAPSIEKFRSACPVKPIQMFPGEQGRVYDTTDLDQWIDSLKPSASGSTGDWLDRLGSGTGQKHAGADERA